MGTVGGKIGFVAAVIAGFFAVEPMIKLFLGSCFFEQGCGETETARLAAVAGGSVVVAVAAGLLVRVVVNRVLGADR